MCKGYGTKGRGVRRQDDTHIAFYLIKLCLGSWKLIKVLTRDVTVKQVVKTNSLMEGLYSALECHASLSVTRAATGPVVVANS